MEMVTSYGIDGMSSDDSDIEKGQEVYSATQLPWRRAAVSKYLDWLDEERRDPEQETHSKKGKRPGKRYRGGEISARAAIKKLPVALYEPSWYNGLRTTERQMYGTSRNQLKWRALALSGSSSLERRGTPDASGSRRNESAGPSQARNRGWRERQSDRMVTE